MQIVIPHINIVPTTGCASDIRDRSQQHLVTRGDVTSTKVVDIFSQNLCSWPTIINITYSSADLRQCCGTSVTLFTVLWHIQHTSGSVVAHQSRYGQCGGTSVTLVAV